MVLPHSNLWKTKQFGIKDLMVLSVTRRSKDLAAETAENKSISTVVHLQAGE